MMRERERGHRPDGAAWLHGDHRPPGVQGVGGLAQRLEKELKVAGSLAFAPSRPGDRGCKCLGDLVNSDKKVDNCSVTFLNPVRCQKRVHC